MNPRIMQLSDHARLVPLWEPEGMITTFEYLQTVLTRNPATCYVIDDGTRILAAACGLYDGRRGTLQSVAVLPEVRSQGYGKQVVQACVDALLCLYPAARIRLFVQKHNTVVLPFYESLGFEILDDTFYMGLKVAARV
jgi:N-acetylglutamate synthase